jgi:hypothetical protein
MYKYSADLLLDRHPRSTQFLSSKIDRHMPISFFKHKRSSSTNHNIKATMQVCSPVAANGAYSPVASNGPLFHSILPPQQQEGVVHRLCKGLENAYARIQELEGEVECYKQENQSQQQTLESHQQFHMLMQHLQEQNKNQALQIDDLCWRLRQYEGNFHIVDESSVFFPQQERRWS